MTPEGSTKAKNRHMMRDGAPPPRPEPAHKLAKNSNPQKKRDNTRREGMQRISRPTFCLALLFGSTLAAQAADQALIDAAKKEGSVTWYTTLIVNQTAQPAADAFEKKYGIKVNYIRNDSTEIVI